MNCKYQLMAHHPSHAIAQSRRCSTWECHSTTRPCCPRCVWPPPPCSTSSTLTWASCWPRAPSWSTCSSQQLHIGFKHHGGGFPVRLLGGGAPGGQRDRASEEISGFGFLLYGDSRIPIEHVVNKATPENDTTWKVWCYKRPNLSLRGVLSFLTMKIRIESNNLTT
jgi:hypothetical protein